MNKKILFFSVNRHQKLYFDHLLASVKKEDKGVSLHKRSLFRYIPSLSCSKYDINLVHKALNIRLGHYYNKTGIQVGVVRRTLVTCLYFLTTLYFTLKLKNFIASQKCDIIFLWNDMKWRQVIIKNLAESYKIQTAFFEKGALPNTITLDPKGVNYNNSLPRDSDYYLKRYSEGRNDTAQSSSLRRPDLESGYIFVPFQVDYDSQIISHSPWIKNMQSFYQVLERLIANLPEGMKLIIKEHPASVRCYRYLHNKNPRIEFMNAEDTDILIANAKSVITINSTVGLESIMKDKPVLVLGNAFYAIKGLCYQVEHEADLLDKVQELTYPIDSIKNAFFKYLREEYYVKGNCKVPSIEHIAAVEKRLYEIIK
jgi:capsular polysaccharide export protein